MPYYTLHTSSAAYWLIEPDKSNSSKWKLKSIVVGGIDTPCKSFDMPHQAAQAVAEHNTGDVIWDSLASLPDDRAKDWEHSGVHDLKNWERHET